MAPYRLWSCQGSMMHFADSLTFSGRKVRAPSSCATAVLHTPTARSVYQTLLCPPTPGCGCVGGSSLPCLSWLLAPRYFKCPPAGRALEASVLVEGAKGQLLFCSVCCATRNLPRESHQVNQHLNCTSWNSPQQGFLTGGIHSPSSQRGS